MNKENYDRVLSEALGILRSGGTILYPTDTVWGLGCDATNPSAVARIFDIKRRSDSKSLVLLASDLDMVARYVMKIPDIAIDLVEVNDRPMTIIYPGAIVGQRPESGFAQAEHFGEALDSARRGNPAPAGDKWHLAYNAVAADGSGGMRIPMNDFCRDLIRRLGRPLVSTSANISGNPTPKSFKEIEREIVDAVDYVVAPSLGAGATGTASQIIKLEVDGQVEIIRT